MTDSPVIRLANNNILVPLAIRGYSIRATISDNKISCDVGIAGQTTNVTYCNLRFK